MKEVKRGIASDYAKVVLAVRANRNDNKGAWIVRYFGRLCLEGARVDIASDEKMNLENHQYDKVSWGDYDIFIEPLQIQYQTELARNRKERIKAIEE